MEERVGENDYIIRPVFAILEVNDPFFDRNLTIIERKSNKFLNKVNEFDENVGKVPRALPQIHCVSLPKETNFTVLVNSLSGLNRFKTKPFKGLRLSGIQSDCS